MSKIQQSVAGLAFIVAALLGLVPPWKLQLPPGEDGQGTFLGHAPLWAPPSSSNGEVTVDLLKLFAYWGILLLLTIGGLLLVSPSRSREN